MINLIRKLRGTDVTNISFSFFEYLLKNNFIKHSFTNIFYRGNQLVLHKIYQHTFKPEKLYCYGVVLELEQFEKQKPTSHVASGFYAQIGRKHYQNEVYRYVDSHLNDSAADYSEKIHSTMIQVETRLMTAKALGQWSDEEEEIVEHFITQYKGTVAFTNKDKRLKCIIVRHV